MFPLNKLKNISAFSLVEALIATMIMSIAFTGVYSITIFSARQINNAQARERLQMVANQILEVIESDEANITNYVGNLSSCSAPGSGVTTKYIVRKYEWCTRLNSTVGQMLAGDTRSITYTSNANGHFITVTLTSKAGANKVIVKRTYE